MASENELALKLKSIKTDSKKEPARKIASCQLCNSQERIYVCENGHKNLFCKECLKAVIQFRGAVYFKAKCTPKGNCNYQPLNPNGIGMFASNPYQ